MPPDGQRLSAIAGFRLVTADLSRLARFYQEALGFAGEAPEQPIDDAEMALLGLAGSGRRRTLRLGDQELALQQFDPPGRPYPGGAGAASLVFQHLALVVADMAAAYARVRDAPAISRDGPQTLPARDGGVRAYKFRDPDGHPLELLHFPLGTGRAAWRGRTPLAGQIALGIDHSAISVADAAASAEFYAALGLAAERQTLNHGPEQERLDDLRDAQVLVAPMRPAVATPHLELLGYRVSRGGAAAALRANDVAATRIVWRGARAALLRDPDGHFQQITASAEGPPS